MGPTSESHGAAAPRGFAWGDSASAPPQAWASGRVQVHGVLDFWQEVQLYLERQELPLSLRRRSLDWEVWADWPALEPGFYQLELRRQGTVLIGQRIFVGSRHLNAAQWIQLLQELRYGWPEQALAWQGNAQVPVQPSWELHAVEAEEIQRLQTIFEGDSEQVGLLWALDWLARHARAQIQTRAQVVPLQRLRRPEPRLLYRDPRSLPEPQAVWQHLAAPSLDLPEHRFVAYLVQCFETHLQALKVYLQARGQSALVPQIEVWQRALWQKWQGHPLASLPVRFAPPENLACFEQQPAYAAFLQAWQRWHQGALPLWNGRHQLAYRSFALLYQTWCLRQLSLHLRLWGEANAWTLVRESPPQRRGQLVLQLCDKSGATLSLFSERLYAPQKQASAGKALFSVSRPQRPDISLLMSSGEHLRLWVFECKFRAEASGSNRSQPTSRPFKEDLDRLHAYRDAIRRADGAAVVAGAVLLYPGPSQAYPPLLEAWSAQPAKPLDWPLSKALQEL